MAIESSFVETLYGKFHVEAAGSGKPVLFIHGGTASAREWRPVLEALGGHARCVAVDRLGCGLSDRSRGYDRETLTNSLFALADALGWDRFGVVGQSFGGFWAQSMAFARPERISRLVIVNGGAAPMTESELAQLEAQRASRGPVGTPTPPADREAMIDRTIRSIFADPSRIPASYRDDLRWQMEHADPGQLDAAGEGRLRMARESFDRLAMPTLVVWGEADTMGSPGRGERLVAAIPGARYAGLPGIGHTCQIEAPQAFVAAVAPFLQETEAFT